MVGSIVANVTTGVFTPLQLSLGLLLHEKKKIHELSKYCVTCSYDEIRRFKVSASIDEQSKNTVLDAKHGLIQYVSDNFDTQIFSQNGLKQTHGLASVVTQPMTEEKNESKIIVRAPKTKMSELQLAETNRKIFVGVKNPEMPTAYATGGVLPLKMLCKMAYN